MPHHNHLDPGVDGGLEGSKINNFKYFSVCRNHWQRGVGIGPCVTVTWEVLGRSPQSVLLCAADKFSAKLCYCPG